MDHKLCKRQDERLAKPEVASKLEPVWVQIYISSALGLGIKPSQVVLVTQQIKQDSESGWNKFRSKKIRSAKAGFSARSQAIGSEDKAW